MDEIVNRLDSYGLSNGNLQIANNNGSLSSAAQPAYDNLISKGWTIDLPSPTPSPGPQIFVVRGDLGNPIPNGNTPDTSDGTDFGTVGLETSVTQTFEIQNIGDSDLTINFFGTQQTAHFTFLPPFDFGIVLAAGESTSIAFPFLLRTSSLEVSFFSAICYKTSIIAR